MTPINMTLAAVAALAAAGAAKKRGSSNAQGCDIWQIDPEWGEDYPGDRDGADIADDVLALFRAAGVRPSNREEHTLACLDDDGTVLGGAAYGYSYEGFGEDEHVEFVFSVVVDPKARRRGIAQALVKELEDIAESMSDFDSPVKIEAQVVNPNMAKLLDKMGFKSTAYDGKWKPAEPYYEKDLMQ